MSSAAQDTTAERGAASTEAAAEAEEEARTSSSRSYRPDRAHPRGAGRRGERVMLWVALVVALVTPLVSWLDPDVPGRFLLALAFGLLVPGVPAVSLLRVPDPLVAGSLAVGLSIAVTMLVATVEVETGWWNPTAFALATAVLSAFLTLIALRTLATTPAAADAVRASGRSRERVVPAALLTAAVLLWWLATRWVDLDAAGALGVLDRLNWPYVAALLLVAAVAGHQLTRPSPDGWVLAAAAVVFTVIVFAFTNVADGVAGVPVGWAHVGFAGFIRDNQTSFDGLDARAFWPGFFAAAAHLTQLAGVPDASGFLLWAPVFHNVAAIAPLLVIARCVTSSSRLAWLSVFIYLSGNWIQQDYWSPQATAFLLYLALVASLLWLATEGSVTVPMGRWFSRLRRGFTRRPDLPVGVSTRRALGWQFVLLVLCAAIVAIHQLTPVSVVLALLVFVVTGYTRFRWLWLAVALVFLGWFSYAAVGFWSGQLATVVNDLGRPASNLDSAVTARLDVDGTYALMQNVRVGWTLLLASAGVAGWWTIRRQPRGLLIAGLAGCSAALVLLGSYGGEVVLRVFLFGAPVLAPLAALAARRAVTALGGGRLHGRRAAAALTAGLVVGGLGVTVTRGVNIGFERVTAADLAVARVLSDRLDVGDVIASFGGTGALASQRIGEWLPSDISETTCGEPPLECVASSRPDWIVVSRAQDVLGQLRESLPAGWTGGVVQDLRATGEYVVAWQQADVVLLERVGGEG